MAFTENQISIQQGIIETGQLVPVTRQGEPIGQHGDNDFLGQKKDSVYVAIIELSYGQNSADAVRSLGANSAQAVLQIGAASTYVPTRGDELLINGNTFVIGAVKPEPLEGVILSYEVNAGYA